MYLPGTLCTGNLILYLMNSVVHQQVLQCMCRYKYEFGCLPEVAIHRETQSPTCLVVSRYFENSSTPSVISGSIQIRPYIKILIPPRNRKKKSIIAICLYFYLSSKLIGHTSQYRPLAGPFHLHAGKYSTNATQDGVLKVCLELLYLLAWL